MALPAAYVEYPKYDQYVKKSVKKNRQPVEYEGRVIGELQYLASWSLYSVGALCFQHGSQCKRTRSWKAQTTEPIEHVDCVLTKWLIAGLKPDLDKDSHTDPKQHPRE